MKHFEAGFGFIPENDVRRIRQFTRVITCVQAYLYGLPERLRRDDHARSG
jgi:hypothetical protein